MYFLYLIDAGQISETAIKAAGLGHLPPAATLVTRGMMDGPDSRSCLMVADSRCDVKRMRYVPAEQTWTQSVNERFWIGFWNDAKPTEASLRRETMVEGNPVVLDDGAAWQIPCARVFNPGQPPSSKLPYVLIGTDAGVTCRMKSEFVDFSAAAERLWEQLLTQVGLCDGKTLTFDEEYRLCLRALAINYHVGIDEINALEILTTANMNRIGPAIVDFDAFADFLQNTVKKK